MIIRYDSVPQKINKITGIPECVDMATVAMATELGHVPVQTACSSIDAVKDRVRGEECEKEKRL